ncbi:hypothetical protein HBB16_15920 [Pseudonocardia sp. MCCB 268]|nr:hypothetical protein [Pseudonocardia cytotoxica]
MDGSRSGRAIAESVFPVAGRVDVVVAWELMECGRAVQRGVRHPGPDDADHFDSRVYSIDEDARGRQVDRAAPRPPLEAAKQLVAADFAAIRRGHRSVISAAPVHLRSRRLRGALPFTASSASGRS